MKLHYECVDINNFGDIIPKYIFEKWGKTIEWIPQIGGLYFGGSVMAVVKDNSTVFGCGFMYDSDIFTAKDCHIISVRGKLTREILLKQGIACPEIYADMADLLPQYYNPKVDFIGGDCFLPHYKDYKTAMQLHDQSRVINITLGVEPVIAAMLRFDTIYSSSLHGIIAAKVYGKKFVWTQYDNDISEFKFYDYFSRFGMSMKPLKV